MRRLLWSVGIGGVGMAAVLAGLVWDAVLHGADPSLAATEGVFTLSNPGHLLLVGGIGVACLGLLLTADAALALRGGGSWGGEGGRLRRVTLGAAVVVLAGVAATAAWADSRGHAHPAIEDAAHSHAAVRAVDGHADGDTHGDGHGDGHAAADPSGATPAQRSAADRLLADTRTAAARWASLDAAKADGFRPITPVLNGLQHWHNQRFFTDGAILDPQAPEELIYATTSRGPVLVAAMYLMERVDEPGPTIGGPLTVWHDHEDLCFSADGRVVGFHRPPRQTCPPGSVNQRTPEMLHVWLVDNPAGPFAAEMEPAALLAIAEGGPPGRS
ncbi:MAG: hypothetical protein KY434_09535 [Actinobacteria bacterium]|nr:hypothetical protein [Actinomycetota bacterium]